MRRERTVPVVVDGQNTYQSGGVAQIDWTKVPRIPGCENFVKSVKLYYTLTWDESAGGAITVPEIFPFRAIDQIRLDVPNLGGHKFFALTGQAGNFMRALNWAREGRRPTPPNGGAGGALTINTTDVTRQELYLPFYFPGMTRPSDTGVPLRDLLGSIMEFQWPNMAAAGGIFDTGGNNEGISAGTLTAEIELVGKKNYVASPLWTIGSAELGSLEETLTFFNGRIPHWLLEVPVQPDSLTENFITDAERDEINISFGGNAWVDRIDAREAIRRWNAIHAVNRDEQLSHHEGDASPFVPLFQPLVGARQGGYNVTHLPRGDGDVTMRLTGTDTTPRVVYVTSELNKEEAVLRRLEGNKLRLPEGFAKAPGRFMSVSTKAKTGIPIGPDGAQRLPVKIHSLPVGPDA